MSRHVQHPKCDGNKCLSDQGEVKLLPYADDGNLKLCFNCFRHEMAYRKRKNTELQNSAFDILNWDDLLVYQEL